MKSNKPILRTSNECDEDEYDNEDEDYDKDEDYDEDEDYDDDEDDEEDDEDEDVDRCPLLSQFQSALIDFNKRKLLHLTADGNDNDSGQQPQPLEELLLYPSLQEEDRQQIVRELQHAFRTQFIEIFDFGAYYTVIHSLNMSLDGDNDDCLLENEYNVTVGLFIGNSSSKAYNDRFLIKFNEYYINLTFACLHSWAKIVIAPPRVSNSSISVVEDQHHQHPQSSDVTICTVPHNIMQFCDGAPLAVEMQLQEPDVEVLNGSPSTETINKSLSCFSQVFTALKVLKQANPKAKTGPHSINLDDVQESLVDWTGIYEEVIYSVSSSGGGAMSLPFSVPAKGVSQQWLDDRVASTFSSLSSSIAAAVADEGPPVLYQLLVAWLDLLKGAVAVDTRIAMAIDAKDIATIMSIQLDYFETIIENNQSNDDVLVGGAEGIFLRSCDVIGSMYDNLVATNYRSGQMMEFMKSDDIQSEVQLTPKLTRFAYAAEIMIPVLLRAVSIPERISPIVCQAALNYLDTIVQSFLVSDKFALSLLTSSAWKIITSRLLLQHLSPHPSEHQRFDPKIYFRRDGMHINSLPLVTKFVRIGIMTLLMALCRHGQRTHTQGTAEYVAAGVVSVRMIKRGVVPLLLHMISAEGGEEEDVEEECIEVQRIVVELLQCLTRTRDCRVIMLHGSDKWTVTGNESTKGANKLYGLSHLTGEALLRKLLSFSDTSIASQTILLMAHLLYDSEWQEIILSLRCQQQQQQQQQLSGHQQQQEQQQSEDVLMVVARRCAAAIDHMETRARRLRLDHSFYTFLSNELRIDASGIRKSYAPPIPKKDTVKRLLMKKQLEDKMFSAPGASLQVQMNMGTAALYPIFDGGNEAMLLFSRCILMLSQLTPSHLGSHLFTSHQVEQRLSNIHLWDLLSSSIDIYTQGINKFALQGLSVYTTDGMFLPHKMNNPKRFIDSFMGTICGMSDRCVCNYFQETLSPRGLGAAGNNSIFSSKISLLNGMNKNQHWKPYIDNWRRKQHPHNKSDIDMLFRTVDMYSSNRSQVLLRPAEVHQLQHLHNCAVTSCGKIDKVDGIFKCCGRCKKVYYCSRECQVAHWKVHKQSCC